MTGYMPSTVGGGERSDAGTAYLYPAAGRPNLDILAGMQVTRLLPVPSRDGKISTDFRIVEIARSKEG